VPIMFMTALSTAEHRLEGLKLAQKNLFRSRFTCASCCCASSTCSNVIQCVIEFRAMAA